MNVRPISSNLLDPQTAAAHCGLLISTYCRLTKANILPEPPTTTELLDRAIDLLLHNGFGTPTKKSEYKPLPYATVVWRKLSDDTYRPHAEWRHYPERKSIEHPFGSAAMFREWLALECATLAPPGGAAAPAPDTASRTAAGASDRQRDHRKCPGALPFHRSAGGGWQAFAAAARLRDRRALWIHAPLLDEARRRG